MIVAIEGLIPDRRVSPLQTQPAAPPVKAQIYSAEWRRRQLRVTRGSRSTEARNNV